MGDLPAVFISCRVFETLLSRYLPAGTADAVIYLEYGLHSRPRQLHDALQSAIDAIAVPSLIVLAYGLCGNGLKGICSGIHTILMPRTEDCIAIFLGSDEAYRAEFDAHPGTYYLTGGWLESGSNPLQEYEKAVTKFGEETAQWIMDQNYQHYKRLALVCCSAADLQKYRERALRVAKYCEHWNMAYQEIHGSDDYIRRLVEAAADLSKADGAFRIVPPAMKID
ncbi:MAG TPA: DUF1638 domain-containing protein [Anaerolineales bacterium]|nr:DUF1638 domain-containing protein [Anaerolineales bacterium]